MAELRKNKVDTGLFKCVICAHSNCFIAVDDARENIERTKRLYTYVVCSACGIYTLWPRPTFEQIHDHYAFIDCQSVLPDEYAVQDDLDKKDDNMIHGLMPFLTKPLNLLRRLWRNFNEQYPYLSIINEGYVLDLGSGAGGFCQRLRNLHIDCLGIEMSAQSVQLARSNGLNIVQGDISKLAELQLTVKADFITLNHVFEHIAEPRQFLEQIRDFLKPKARIIFMLPNPCCFLSLVFGGNWHGWDPPIHTHLYSKKALAGLLNRLGYEIDSMYTKARPDGLTRSLNHVFKFKHARLLWLRLMISPFLILLDLFKLGDEIVCIASLKKYTTDK